LTKAVYAYPTEHYSFWQTVRAQAKAAAWDQPLQPGALGENLSLEGLLESEVCIGDLLRFADCELAVSEPRFPCFKFNAAMGFNQAAKLMGQNAWCGFYLAVRTPGTMRPGESFELVPGPREVGIQELFRAKMRKPRP
jgi:MOSC domain-containing protein YiiM